jgi:polysaccharide pyruvyl transferase WcaK-like protein
LANRKIFEHYNVNGASWYEHIENICLKVKEHLGDNENLYLAHTTAPDFESQSEILNDLNKFLNINILHFPKQLDLDEYINLASSSRLIIASRMHALIIGEISGAEAAPIIINKKLLNYSSNLGDRNTTQLSSELWLCAKEAYEW